MYSILKSQRRKLKHNQCCVITAAVYLTDNIALFCFSNSNIMIINIQADEQDEIKDTFSLPHKYPIFCCGRLNSYECILLSKYGQYLYYVKIDEDSNVSIVQLDGTPLSNTIEANNEEPVFLNSLGCTTELYTFKNQTFCIKNHVFQNRKVFMSFYTPQISTNKNLKFISSTLEYDLPIGDYVIEISDRIQSEIVLYKQRETQEVDWNIKFIKIKSNNQSDFLKESNIVLPTEHFGSDRTIVQIIKWINDQYLILTYDLNWSMAAFRLKNINHVQPYLEFKQIDNFKSIIYTDLNSEICYALRYAHQRLKGQLYENCLDIINMKNGNIIEVGYCNLKNFDISPDGRKILDIASELSSNEQNLYHVRLLLEKKSLYMFILQNSPFAKELPHSFRQSIVGML